MLASSSSLEEKRVWEIKAKHAKAEHKQMYPNYRFRPVHNKSKETKPKTLIPTEDERRCENVAQLLLEGMKGEELATAVERLDRMRSTTPINLPRRLSSVPLPNSSFPIAIPALPFIEPSRPHSPRAQQMIHPRCTLPCRPSSVGPSLYRSWTEPFTVLRDPSPCPRSMRLCSTASTWTPGTGSQSDALFVRFISFSLPYTLTTYDKNFRTSGRCLVPFPAVLRYVCSPCRTSYSQRQGLTRHIRRAHNPNICLL